MKSVDKFYKLILLLIISIYFVYLLVNHLYVLDPLLPLLSSDILKYVAIIILILFIVFIMRRIIWEFGCFFKRIIRFFKKHKQKIINKVYTKQIYFQEKPIDDYEDDFIGVEAETDLLLDEIVHDSRVIGLISEYGSGKSSIISLLEKNIEHIVNYGEPNHKSVYNFSEKDVKKINVIKVNLFDDDGKINYNDKLELHKKMILEIAKQKNEKYYELKFYQVFKKLYYRFSGRKKKINYILKRVNPSYRVIDVDTSNRFSKVLFFISVLMIVLNIIYNTDVLSLWKKGLDEINIIKYMCTYGGIIGFVLLVISIFIGKIVVSYSKSYKGLEFGEYDAQLLFNKVMDNYDVIVLEDLDRLNQPNDIKRFINEIYSYYSNIKRITFVLPITPKIFDDLNNTSSRDNYNQVNKVHFDIDSNTTIELSQGDTPANDNSNQKEFTDLEKNNRLNTLPGVVDRKYKLFTSVLHLPKIKNSDYSQLLKKLIEKKKIGLNNDVQSIFDFDNSIWNYLAIGENLNMRIIKNRLNEAMHLIMLNNSRRKIYSIDSCVYFTYLKDRYGDEFKNLTEEKFVNGFITYDFKKIVDEYSMYEGQGDIETITSVNIKNKILERDIIEGLKNGYIEFYNYEYYIFNYIKEDKNPVISNIDELNMINAYISNTAYIYDDNKIQSLIDNNSNWIENAIIRRKELYKNNFIQSIPKNIFDSIPIFKYIFSKIDAKDKPLFYLKKLPLNEKTSNSTLKSLGKISSTISKDILNDYIRSICDDFKTNTEVNTIINVRKKLLNIFKDKMKCLLPLFDDSFPIVTSDELKIITDYSDNIYDFINVRLLNSNNIGIYINYINFIEQRGKNKKKLKYNHSFFDNIGSECTDYVSKHLHSLKYQSNDEKEKYYENNKEFIDLKSVSNIVLFEKNINYSYSELEQIAINSLNTNAITKVEYANFVNSLPFVNHVTLEFLEKDICDFSLKEALVNQFRDIDARYGYHKFRTINEGAIPKIRKKEIKYYIYDRFYSSKLFTNYILADEKVSNEIINNNIYSKHDATLVGALKNGVQTIELIRFIFENRNVIDINDYFSSIKKTNITCQDFRELYKMNENAGNILSNAAKENIYKASNKEVKGQIKKNWLNNKA